MTKNMILIIAVIGILMINFASADVPPENSHPLSRCVKFVNLNNFSDVVLIGYYTGPTIGWGAYQIENDKCLDKGYKFNTLYIYWTTKEKFHSINLVDLKLVSKKVALSGSNDDKGNQAYIDVYSPADLILLLENIEPYGGDVNENNPLINETIEYSVAGYSDGKLVAYISKKTSEYNNGQSEKVETFEKPNINNKEPVNLTPTLAPTQNPNINNKESIYPTPTPEPIQNPEPLPVKKSFWNSISCFFKKLFGGSC